MHPQRSTKLLAFRGEPNFGGQITAHFFFNFFGRDDRKAAADMKGGGESP